MLTPSMGNKLPPDVLWAADTGCFKHPERFNLGQYLRWLHARSYAANRCLFATAPDVVGDPRATWERSKAVLPEIRYLGYKAALCAQDGIEETEIPWAAFDALFIGGSTEWKLGPSVELLIRAARRQGKWVHVGRVNSAKRYRMFRLDDCDSADGTFIAFRDRGGNRGRGARTVGNWTAQETIKLGA